MPVDESLARSLRAVVTQTDGVVEKKMFGGLAFLVQGNMSVGVHGAELVVRVEPAEGAELLREPGVRAFDITGRPMKGWLLVSADVLRDPAALRAWVERGVSYARSLPAK
jgi:TfoX/Sxy family transcriptional regulator of competence genes